MAVFPVQSRKYSNRGEYVRLYNIKNAKIIKEKRLKRYKENREYEIQRQCNKRAKETIALYKLLGNKCVVCKESDPIYFQIDHVNNDSHIQWKNNGKKGSRKTTMKKYLTSPESYQLMCANCNHAKRMNDGKIYKPKKKKAA